ncbi:thiamine pyrophosphate-binding protein [Pseudonocardia sp. HH130630-07]|uniref:thiamine pyrophosphate-binding protein n=1 Tax=Pseudonocardia sp. HH130630-07 TaxID=1690815 RepID=UPI000814CA2C|nr:thiamine pyrophosphate-dependent enzyme [Pseudonocardia sp. HH130630-07]ANY08830.1 acetolactate synthase [Pseudonocardia sp. HH130630-07]
MSTTVWGSDRIAEAVAATGTPYVALTPGASFRGLHDSLVNHLGPGGPQLLLCTHEEHSVAIAHGYAKVTGEPLAVGLHANVGLMHATMAVYNAWCDRVPVLLIGATGPVDAHRRRPWIDWIHTSADQGALIRPFVKWDDQPASAGASVDSVLHAARVARTLPAGPAYVCLDVTVQEEPAEGVPQPDPRAAEPVGEAAPRRHHLDRVAALLAGAARPVLLVGRVGRSRRAWDRRVALAERLGARVVTDAKLPAAFPTHHPLHGHAPAFFLAEENKALLRDADVVLALDWTDLGGTLRAAGATGATVVSATVDHQVHNGWSKDGYGPAPAALTLAATPDVVVEELLAGDGDAPAVAEPGPRRPAARADAPHGAGHIAVPVLQTALWDATRGCAPCLIRTPLSWDAELWPLEDPLDALGYDGGGGIGSGPGMAVGAALALRGTGRLPVAVLGDGDTLMGNGAVWTAVRHEIPLLVVVANNASFYNDEVHQRAVATRRGRPPENATVGVALDGPVTDFAGLARSMGAQGIGPVTDPGALPEVLADAVARVVAGAQVVVDVRVDRGYSPAFASTVGTS